MSLKTSDITDESTLVCLANAWRVKIVTHVTLGDGNETTRVYNELSSSRPTFYLFCSQKKGVLSWNALIPADLQKIFKIPHAVPLTIKSQDFFAIPTPVVDDGNMQGRSILVSLMVLDGLFSKTCKTYESQWPVTFGGVQLVHGNLQSSTTYRTRVVTALRLAGNHSDSSKLARESVTKSSMIESNPSMIFHILSTIHVWRPYSASDVHVTFGSGRRSSLVFSLCAWQCPDMCIIGVEVTELACLESRRMLRLLQKKDTTFCPCVQIVNQDFKIIKSIEGVTSSARFCGSNKASGLDMIDVMIFRTSTMCVYWNNHITQKSFDKMDLTDLERKGWKLGKLPNQRQEQSRFTVYIWMRNVPDAYVKDKAADIRAWINAAKSQALFSEESPICSKVKKTSRSKGKTGHPKLDVVGSPVDSPEGSVGIYISTPEENASTVPKRSLSDLSKRKRLSTYTTNSAKNKVSIEDFPAFEDVFITPVKGAKPEKGTKPEKVVVKFQSKPIFTRSKVVKEVKPIQISKTVPIEKTVPAKKVRDQGRKKPTTNSIEPVLPKPAIPSKSTISEAGTPSNHAIPEDDSLHKPALFDVVSPSMPLQPNDAAKLMQEQILSLQQSLKDMQAKGAHLNSNCITPLIPTHANTHL